MNAKHSPSAYGADLAFIHDAGFGGFASAAADTLLDLLRAHQPHGGCVVDLGCGSGILAAQMVQAGFEVRGYDISADMVALSRRRVPKAVFEQASVLDVEIPDCVAVTAVGEIFNYLFDRRNSLARLKPLFRRIHRALAPGGWFLFDVATPGRVPGGTARNYREDDDWACLFEAREDRARKLLTREITTFRKVGRSYRRDSEVHRLRLFEREELTGPLRELGFRVRVLRRYGQLGLPPGYVGFLARKG